MVYTLLRPRRGMASRRRGGPPSRRATTFPRPSSLPIRLVLRPLLGLELAQPLLQSPFENPSNDAHTTGGAHGYLYPRAHGVLPVRTGRRVEPASHEPRQHVLANLQVGLHAPVGRGRVFRASVADPAACGAPPEIVHEPAHGGRRGGGVRYLVCGCAGRREVC